MRFMMSTEEKKSDDGVPSFAITEIQPSPATVTQSRKKYVIVAVSGVVAVALILTAILVGVYILTEAEKDIVTMTSQMKNNATQEMWSNPNTNTVQFHVKEQNQETWTVLDYNSDMKVMKIQTTTETNCFVTPLNETSPMETPNMKSYDSQTKTGAVTISYSTNGSPIKDNSFLSKTARDMCGGVSTYWLYPSCSDPTVNNAPNTTMSSNGRQKRSLYVALCGDVCYCSYCIFTYTSTIRYDPYCATQGVTSPCCVFQWWFYSYPYDCTMYRCTGC